MPSKSQDEGTAIVCVACIAVISSVLFPPIILLWILVVIFWIYSRVQKENLRKQRQLALEQEMRQKQLARELEILRSGIREIDQMEGYEFEVYLALLFRKAGYDVTQTPQTGDFGADLILIQNGIRTVVQAKNYSGSVGNKAVQEVAAARNHYGAGGAIVITNSYFTPAAIQLARSNGVQLWNRDVLITFINRVKGQ